MNDFSEEYVTTAPFQIVTTDDTDEYILGDADDAFDPFASSEPETGIDSSELLKLTADDTEDNKIIKELVQLQKLKKNDELINLQTFIKKEEPCWDDDDALESDLERYSKSDSQNDSCFMEESKPTEMLKDLVRCHNLESKNVSFNLKKEKEQEHTEDCKVIIPLVGELYSTDTKIKQEIMMIVSDGNDDCPSDDDASLESSKVVALKIESTGPSKSTPLSIVTGPSKSTPLSTSSLQSSKSAPLDNITCTQPSNESSLNNTASVASSTSSVSALLSDISSGQHSESASLQVSSVQPSLSQAATISQETNANVEESCPLVLDITEVMEEDMSDDDNRDDCPSPACSVSDVPSKHITLPAASAPQRVPDGLPHDQISVNTADITVTSEPMEVIDLDSDTNDTQSVRKYKIIQNDGRIHYAQKTNGNKHMATELSSPGEESSATPNPYQPKSRFGKIYKNRRKISRVNDNKSKSNNKPSGNISSKNKTVPVRIAKKLKKRKQPNEKNKPQRTIKAKLSQNTQLPIVEANPVFKVGQNNNNLSKITLVCISPKHPSVNSNTFCKSLTLLSNPNQIIIQGMANTQTNGSCNTKTNQLILETVNLTENSETNTVPIIQSPPVTQNTAPNTAVDSVKNTVNHDLCTRVLPKSSSCLALKLIRNPRISNSKMTQNLIKKTLTENVQSPCINIEENKSVENTRLEEAPQSSVISQSSVIPQLKHTVWNIFGNSSQNYISEKITDNERIWTVKENITKLPDKSKMSKVNSHKFVPIAPRPDTSSIIRGIALSQQPLIQQAPSTVTLRKKLNDQPKKFFRCRVCFKTYPDRKSIMKHVKDDHKDYRSATCKMCNRIFRNKKFRRMHKCKEG